MLHNKGFEEIPLSASVRGVMNRHGWNLLLELSSGKPGKSEWGVTSVSPAVPWLTEAEFGSGYLSVMDDHYYLPGEMETR